MVAVSSMQEPPAVDSPESEPTLLARILQEGVERGPLGYPKGEELGVPQALLKEAGLVDAAGAFEYFWARGLGPSAGPASFPPVRDFPNCDPGFMQRFAGENDRAGSAFFEGRCPVGEGAWVRAGILAVGGRVGSGVVGEDLEAELPQAARSVLRLTPYLELHGEPGRRLAGPAICWLVAVGEHGGVLVEGSEGVPFEVLRDPDAKNAGAAVDHVWAHETYRGLAPLLYAALFAVCCANWAALRGQVPNALLKVTPRPIRRGNIQLVPVQRGSGLWKLDPLPLLKRLEERGRARDMGLGHALLSCRSEFFAEAKPEPAGVIIARCSRCRRGIGHAEREAEFSYASHDLLELLWAACPECAEAAGVTVSPDSPGTRAFLKQAWRLPEVPGHVRERLARGERVSSADIIEIFGLSEKDQRIQTSYVGPEERLRRYRAAEARGRRGGKRTPAAPSPTSPARAVSKPGLGPGGQASDPDGRGFPWGL